MKDFPLAGQTVNIIGTKTVGTVIKNDYIAKETLIKIHSAVAPQWYNLSDIELEDQQFKVVLENKREVTTVSYDYSGTVVEFHGEKYELKKL